MTLTATDDPIVSDELRAPFPYFGGKRRVASLVWSRFGNVDTYNEPFFGSGAVLLARPHAPRIETVNDIDYHIANFWRAVQGDPEQVAYYADNPVNEADLHAWHRWLVETARERTKRVRTDPEFFDAKIAGRWVWGQCLWIGSGWCQSQRELNRGRNKRPKLRERGTDGVPTKQFERNGQGTAHQRRRPHLSSEQGIVSRHANGADSDRVVEWDVRPDLSAANGRGGVMVEAQRSARTRSGENPHRQQKKFRSSHSDSLTGVHRRWQGGGQGGGSGVHAPSLKQQIPMLAGSGITADGLLKSDGLYDYIYSLAARLRRVRVCCGDWQRVLTPSVTTYIGICGVFLDPPYAHDLRERCYAEDHDISADVRTWALEHGDDPNMRIALCGYEGEHEMPASWECVPWKAHGGYSRSERGKANRSRERIWFSPHCLKPGLPLEVA